MTTAIAEPIFPSPNLNILHVGKFYPPHMGGMETHLQALCENLQPFVSLRVVVANSGHQSTEDSIHGVKVIRVGTLFNFSAAAICPRMVAEIRRSKADIVHLHLPNPMATVAYLASGHRGKLVITYHSDVVRQKFLARIFQPILYRLLKRCSVIIATSPNYIATSRVLKDFRDRCQVIPYGIPVEQFQLPDQTLVDRIREKHGDRLVLSVGRLVYYKGFEYLIRAMVKVRGRLLIIGDGPLRRSLEQLAIDCGVADRVVFLGEVQNEDTIPYYHATDLFALASIARSEAFGIVQLEAMACGKPVVNTWLDSGVPFVSLDEVSGLTVLPMDSDALAGTINVLLDDPELRAKYGASARVRVREKFALEVMTRRMLQLYAQVAGQQTDWATGLVTDGAEKGLVGATVGVTAGASAHTNHQE
jgi:glycosyltransferase involved in cell wall biosynthesis